MIQLMEFRLFWPNGRLTWPCRASDRQCQTLPALWGAPAGSGPSTRSRTSWSRTRCPLHLWMSEWATVVNEGPTRIPSWTCRQRWARCRAAALRTLPLAVATNLGRRGAFRNSETSKLKTHSNRWFLLDENLQKRTGILLLQFRANQLDEHQIRIFRANSGSII